MHPAGFEPAITPIKQLQTHVLAGAASAIVKSKI
jgi:hypothetical protein